MSKIDNTELGEVQLRFAELVWKNQPIASGELVKLCAEELKWKKPTTYTVLRKLCEKGLFENKNGTVVSLVTREQYFSAKTEQFVDETFGGSLPAFIAAFTSGKKLSGDDISEIQKMIDTFKAEG